MNMDNTTTRDIRKTLPRTSPLELPTLGLIVLCYGLWTLAGLWIWPIAPWLVLTIMAVMAALHSSLVHECLHGHPTRHRWINEALVFFPLSWIYPYRRFKDTHLAHHKDERITDPLEDPESYYKTRTGHAQLSKTMQTLLHINNTMIGRVLLAPWLGGYGFLKTEWSDVRNDVPGSRKAWILHAIGLVPTLALIVYFGIPLWLYLLAVVWPSLSLIAIRSFAEHRWHLSPEGRTIIVEKTPLAWLFLNNNLHIVHHEIPTAPWYALPKLYEDHKAHWHRLNDGYVYPNYMALFRAHALTAKEPVIHPVIDHKVETTSG